MEEISVIASSSIDGLIRSWDLKTGKEQLRFKPCGTPVYGVTAVGGKFLAASHQFRNASASSGSIFYLSWTKEVRSFPVESITVLTANSEGTYLVGGGSSGDIYLWEVATGKLLKKWRDHLRSVTCLVFSGDDSLLVSGSEDGYVIVWSLIRLFDDSQRQRGNTLYEHKFEGHAMPVTDIVIDYGGCNAMIVSASQDMTYKVWGLSEGKLLRDFHLPSAVKSLALDPGGSVFYAGAIDSNIYIVAFNSKTQVLGSVSEKRKASVTCLAYCAQGNLLISGSEDGMVCVWDLKSRLRIRHLGHGKGRVNNIQVVRKAVVANSNKAQSSWKRQGSLLPPPLDKYVRSGEDAMGGVVIVDPPPLFDVPVYSSFLTADLINGQVKELQQQGSVATEMETKRLKHEHKRSLQMNDQWQKKYENLLQVVMEDLNGGSI